MPVCRGEDAFFAFLHFFFVHHSFLSNFLWDFCVFFFKHGVYFPSFSQFLNCLNFLSISLKMTFCHFFHFLHILGNFCIFVFFAPFWQILHIFTHFFVHFFTKAWCIQARLGLVHPSLTYARASLLRC